MFHTLTRKAQQYTDRQSARERGISHRTVGDHIKSAKARLKLSATQDLLQAYLAEYAEELMTHADGEAEAEDTTPDNDHGDFRPQHNEERDGRPSDSGAEIENQELTTDWFDRWLGLDDEAPGE